MQVRMYKDNGYASASVVDGNPTVATFLVNELQRGSDNFGIFRSQVELGMSDSSYEWCGTGNAHTLCVKGGRVSIANEFAEEEVCELESRDALKLIELWEKFLVTGQEETVSL